MVLHKSYISGQLVPDMVSGIPVERWQRTTMPAQPIETTEVRTWPFDCFLQRFMSSDRDVKVQGARAAEAQKAAPKQPFKQVLKQQPKAGQKPPPLPKHPAAGVNTKGAIGTAAAITGIRATALTSAHAPQLASTENLTQVRSSMHAQASLLREVRTEGQTQNEQKVNARVLELIVKELSTDVRADASPAPQPANAAPETQRKVQELEGATGRASNQGPNPEVAQAKTDPAQVANAKAEAAARLVERIETFVKSNRPALAVTLGGAINARVEVERTGPGEVSLKVQGTKGPPPAEDLARIREAIRQRGLKLSSLSVG